MLILFMCFRLSNRWCPSCFLWLHKCFLLWPCFAGFRRKLIHELKAAEGKREWGLFIDSCFTHCQTQWSGSWNSPTSPRLGNKVGSKSLNCRVYTAVAKQVPWPHIFSTFFWERTIAEAVGVWYFERRKGVKQIDCKYPCNPTCGR
jgi:hypothetical protein